MVRSDENQPIRAVFKMLTRHQASGSLHSASIAALRLPIGVEIRGDHEMIVPQDGVGERVKPSGIVRREQSRRDALDRPRQPSGAAPRRRGQ